MSFKDFIRKYKLKNRATSSMKIYQVISSIGLDDIDICLGDVPSSSDVELVKLHESKGTHWFAYINENYFDSNCCVCPKKVSMYIIERNGHCLN